MIQKIQCKVIPFHTSIFQWPSSPLQSQALLLVYSVFFCRYFRYLQIHMRRVWRSPPHAQVVAHCARRVLHLVLSTYLGNHVGTESSLTWNKCAMFLRMDGLCNQFPTGGCLSCFYFSYKKCCHWMILYVCHCACMEVHLRGKYMGVELLGQRICLSKSIKRNEAKRSLCRVSHLLSSPTALFQQVTPAFSSLGSLLQGFPLMKQEEFKCLPFFFVVYTNDYALYSLF